MRVKSDLGSEQEVGVPFPYGLTQKTKPEQREENPIPEAVCRLPGCRAERISDICPAPKGTFRRGLGRVLEMGAEKLDLKMQEARPPVPAASPEEALNAVKQAVTEARRAYLTALAPLSADERNELRQGLYPVLTEQEGMGQTLSDRTTGRRLLDLLNSLS